MNFPMSKVLLLAAVIIFAVVFVLAAFTDSLSNLEALGVTSLGLACFAAAGLIP